MAQVKTVISEPENDFDLLIQDDVQDDEPDLDSADFDADYIDEEIETGAKKTTKSRAKRRAPAAKKKHYTEDSIRLYLQEIGRIRLLRPEEEIELARLIEDLLYIEDLQLFYEDHFDIDLSDEDCARLIWFSDPIRRKLVEKKKDKPDTEKHVWPKVKTAIEALSDADKQKLDNDWEVERKKYLSSFRTRMFKNRRAKDKMVQSNLRLVVSIAKKYMNRGLSFQDLIQEGSLGLIRAAEKFDHEKGYKFSTYATWWIRQAITRAIADQSRTIRLPVHLYETISRIKKTTKLLSQEMGRKPTEEEIATKMEMTIEKLRFIAKSAQLPISLETPIGKEEDSRLGDFIESDGETPEDQVSKSLLREDLESVLDTLSPRERDVLRLRYGLDDGRMKTLEEIGQIFNVTRERIRQIEAKALRKLRHPNRNSILKEYIR